MFHVEHRLARRLLWNSERSTWNISHYEAEGTGFRVNAPLSCVFLTFHKARSYQSSCHLRKADLARKSLSRNLIAVELHVPRGTCGGEAVNHRGALSELA